MRFDQWLYTLPLRLRSIFQRSKVDAELEEEIADHIEAQTRALVAKGMTLDQARIAARRRFGGAQQIREECRDKRGLGLLDSLSQDLRYTIRQIQRNPGFTATAVLTLALGIGANTAIFSVVDSVLLRPLPYPSADRLVWLGESTQKATGISVTWINFQHWRSDTQAFEELAGFYSTDLTMTGRSDAELVHAGVVTSNFFHLTGSEPIAGRLFGEADDRPGADPSVVISAEFWNRVFGGQSSAVGDSLVLNGKSYRLLGVLSPGLKFFGRPKDIYLPLEAVMPAPKNRSQHGSMRVLGLLKPGVTLSVGTADLDAVMQRLAQSDPGPEDDHHAYARYLTETVTGPVRQPLLLLMAAVGLVLALACANVASLLLLRGKSRSREIAIRAAIGAGRVRIARQLLTENLMTSLLGGALGVLLAWLCLRAVVLLGPDDIPRLSEVTIDAAVALFATAVTLAVGIVAGLAPALLVRKIDLTVALKEGAAGSIGGPERQFLRNGLVVAEFAITVVLIFASGILVRSLIAAWTADPGFEPGHLLALEIQLPSSRYKTNESIRQFYGQLTDALRAQPGVESVGSVTCPPSAGDCGDYWYSVLGKPAPDRGEVPLSLFNTADDDYFSAMQIKLLAGRQFTNQDLEKGPPVVVVNQELASRWWPSPELAVGEQIKMGGPYMDGPVCQIVGVVGNVSQMGLDTKPMPEVYHPFSQEPSSAMVVMIRTKGEAAALAPTVRAEVGSIDRNVPIQSLRTFDKWLGAPLKQRQFTTLLLSAFALIAVVLASIGVYGVLSYWVSVRRKEIAIRLALGAGRSSIVRWIGLHAVSLLALGIAIGGLGALAASQWLRSLAFGVSVADPGAIVAALGGPTAVTLLAIAVPILRALRVDAISTLHNQ